MTSQYAMKYLQWQLKTQAAIRHKVSLGTGIPTFWGNVYPRLPESNVTSTLEHDFWTDQPKWRSYTAVIPSEQRGILFVLARSYSREKRMILAEVSTSNNSVTVSGTTYTPSYMTPNQMQHKAHNILPLKSTYPTQKYVSNICTCSTVLCRGTENSGEVVLAGARSLAVKRTNRVAEYGISITAKRNMCSVNGKQEHKDTFYRKNRSYERVYWSQDVSSLSTVTTCTVCWTFSEIRICNTWFQPHKKMDNQVRSFETLIFCSSFSWSRHPNTMFR